MRTGEIPRIRADASLFERIVFCSLCLLDATVFYRLEEGHFAVGCAALGNRVYDIHEEIAVFNGVDALPDRVVLQLLENPGVSLFSLSANWTNR